jgi:hypothetical protein
MTQLPFNGLCSRPLLVPSYDRVTRKWDFKLSQAGPDSSNGPLRPAAVMRGGKKIPLRQLQSIVDPARFCLLSLSASQRTAPLPAMAAVSAHSEAYRWQLICRMTGTDPWLETRILYAARARYGSSATIICVVAKYTRAMYPLSSVRSPSGFAPRIFHRRVAYRLPGYVAFQIRQANRFSASCQLMTLLHGASSQTIRQEGKRRTRWPVSQGKLGTVHSHREDAHLEIVRLDILVLEAGFAVSVAQSTAAKERTRRHAVQASLFQVGTNSKRADAPPSNRHQ